MSFSEVFTFAHGALMPSGVPNQALFPTFFFFEGVAIFLPIAGQRT